MWLQSKALTFHGCLIHTNLNVTGIYQNLKESLVWWFMTIIPGFRRLHKSEGSLNYMMSLMCTWATEWDSVSKKGKKKVNLKLPDLNEFENLILESNVKWFLWGRNNDKFCSLHHGFFKFNKLFANLETRQTFHHGPQLLYVFKNRERSKALKREETKCFCYCHLRDINQHGVRLLFWPQ